MSIHARCLLNYLTDWKSSCLNSGRFRKTIWNWIS